MKWMLRITRMDRYAGVTPAWYMGRAPVDYSMMVENFYIWPVAVYLRITDWLVANLVYRPIDYLWQLAFVEMPEEDLWAWRPILRSFSLRASTVRKRQMNRYRCSTEYHKMLREDSFRAGMAQGEQDFVSRLEKHLGN
jgi:hypothetical protein